MALDLEIQRLLRTREVNEINFRLAEIRVSGDGFWAVSNHFSNHPIHHRMRVTTNPIQVPPDADACYTAWDNKLHLRSLNVLQSAHGRGDVVHECTHAQCDMRRLGGQLGTRIRYEESAAFIAATWYRLACGEDSATIVPDVGKMIVHIALDLRAQQRVHGALTVLTPYQVTSAVTSMRKIHYRRGRYHNNGIGGPRYIETVYRYRWPH